MATFTAMSILLVSSGVPQEFAAQSFSRKTEIIIKCRGRSRCAKGVDTKAQTVKARNTFPAKGRTGLNADLQHIGGQKVGLVCRVLFKETAHRGHRNHIDAHALRFKRSANAKGDLYFRTGRHDHHLTRGFGRDKAIGTLCRQVRTRLAKLRQVLTGQSQHAGAAFIGDRQLPCFGGFNHVGRAEHFQIRDHAHRHHMFDRLMGRTVLAKANRSWVST
jgi:hypothetical protein